MKISELKIDPVKREEGAWIGDLPEMGGVRLHVRGIGCAEFRKLQAKLVEALPRSKRIGGRIAQEEQDRITGECLHRTILLGWEGFENDDGSPIEYSAEQAKAFMTEPAFSKIREAVVTAASLVAEGVAADTEELAGNSPASSVGSSTGANASAG
ncbi:hypothetical protein ASE61_15080 [Bosea sp. Root670]|uniref:hypothetical protein n=1 Tax=Bosea sp. Root670 TaxID=1736583 RepID=UPI0007158A21|nr:hypothetical protein [Bosea sp. Root670]KRE02598.1 hypothetical protein ASE61_15080 [Bosea sp. Root670]